MSTKIYASQDWVNENAVLVNEQALTDEQKTRIWSNIGVAPSDWNAAEGEAGYVKNRTHWVESDKMEILTNPTLTLKNDSFFFTDEIGLVVGKEYIVTFNGVEYKSTAIQFSEGTISGIALGNVASILEDTSIAETNDPYVFVYAPEAYGTSGYTGYIKALDGSTEVTFSIHQDEVVHKLLGKFLPEGVPYSEGGYAEILPETALVYDEADGGFYLEGEGITAIAGEEYVITWNGVEYTCVAQDASIVMEVPGAVGFGDCEAVFGEAAEGFASNGEPFVLVVLPPEVVAETTVAGFAMSFEGLTEATVSITGAFEDVHKLDVKYIPSDVLTNIKTAQSTAEAAQSAASNAQSTANTALSTANTARSTANQAKTEVSGKMSATNPVGEGSFSMNRLYGTTVGLYSHAEGFHTTASGDHSHAEGSVTVASGVQTHAEGTRTTASGFSSHAEGQHSIASGATSHAEGYYTTASGGYSHAEGDNTTASGDYSHTEGTYTVANGAISHAEGAGTIASGLTQHVQGRYNIEDAEDAYAHIVGNGEDSNKRSNAHTLDWNGVGWFAGGLQVGGNAQDDGAKSVLLEGDAIPTPATAEVSHLLSVKAVDENGAPTEWETVAPADIFAEFGLIVDEDGTLVGGTVTEGGSVSDEQIASAVEAYMSENPIEETDPTVPDWAKAETKPTYTAEEVGALPADTVIPSTLIVTIDDTTTTASHNATEIYNHVQSGGAVCLNFGGEFIPVGYCEEFSAHFSTLIDGVSVYMTIDTDAGVTATATPLAKAEDIPTTLPNPNALTFTGAVSATYDGSGAVSVEIPSGGTNKVVYEEILTEATTHVEVPFEQFRNCANVFVQMYIPSIAEESYSNYIPRIKLSTANAAWSNGKQIALKSVTANATYFVLSGFIIVGNDKAYLGVGTSRAQYTAGTLNSINQATFPEAYTISDTTVICFEINNRTYSIPADSMITVIGY